ncbi:MAG: SOSS complex subunit B family protein [Conexivisphaera sp.]|jgi:replication factor A1
MALQVRVSELKRGVKHVVVEGVVRDMGPVKEFQLPEPLEPARYATATLADDSGEIKLTLWNYDIEGVEAGKRIRVEDGYVTSFKGRLQLNVGFTGRVVLLGAT